MPVSQKSVQPEGNHCSGTVCSRPLTSPIVRAVYQDCYIVTLEWDPPSIPGAKKYELHWAASESYEFRKLRDCEPELSKFGTIPLDEEETVCQNGLLITRVVQWDKVDPTNKLKTYWFAVKTTSKSGDIPPDNFTKIERLHWPSPWKLRVEKMNSDGVTIVWDEPAKTILHEVYGVSYEAAETPRGPSVASGSVKTKAPTLTIRWDKIDPSSKAKSFCFVVSSITEKKDIINHSDLLCVKREQSPSAKGKALHSAKSTLSLKHHKLEGDRLRSTKSTMNMKHGRPEGEPAKSSIPKPPIVRIVGQDNLFISLEWDPPAAGEEKYELHWAGSIKDEFRTDQLSEFGSIPTGAQTELKIGWHNLDSTNKLTTFWFGVKTSEMPPTEFVKVVRKEFPGSWNMRLVKINILGITVAWDPPSWKGHEFYRVIYGAANKQLGVKDITTGKLKIKSTDFTIPWELLDPSERADTFCFMVSSMTSQDQMISSSAPFFVNRECPTGKDKSGGRTEKPTDPKVFYLEEEVSRKEPIADDQIEQEENTLDGEEESGSKEYPPISEHAGESSFPIVQTAKNSTIVVRKNKPPLKQIEGKSEEVLAPRKPPVPKAPPTQGPLTVRVRKKDYDGVELEWAEPDGVEDYTVIYTSCSKSDMCMKNIENYGRKIVRSPKIHLKWTEMDPKNANTMFLIGVQANIPKSKPINSEFLRVIREWPKNPKPPVLRVVKKDGYTVSLEWEPPEIPGEKRYQLQWAACEGTEPRPVNVSKTGHMYLESPNAAIAWDSLDPTNEMKTFWFAVKTFNVKTVLPTGEFLQVFRRDWPRPWNMRVEKINCDGVTIAWDKPAVEDLISYGVSYTAVEKPGGFVITSGKKIMESPVFTVQWDKMDPSNRADIFCFMVSAITSRDVLINSDVFRVKRERLITHESTKSSPVEHEPDFLKSRPARLQEKKVEPSKSKKKEEKKKPECSKPKKAEDTQKPNVRLLKQDVYTVSLEWDPTTVPGDKKYELHWAASLNDEFRTEELTKFGSIPTNRNTYAVVTWHEMDPTDELKTFWFGVKTITATGDIPPANFLRVKRCDWPMSWNMRVDDANGSIVWDEPKAPGHESYAVAYAASEKPGGAPISSGSFKTKSPNFTIRWDEMDPTGRAENFCFVASSMTSDNVLISSSAKYCVRRKRR